MIHRGGENLRYNRLAIDLNFCFASDALCLRLLNLFNCLYELQNYRVLDPACGSGNFLYLAYLELIRIERLLIDKIASRRKGSSEQMAMGFVTLLQFLGMDINEISYIVWLDPKHLLYNSK
jgi:type II restriction/modification system DNA methylase subunit YeeA